MANWATQSDEKMAHTIGDLDTRREEILELTRQAQIKFLEVTAGSASLREDFRTLTSQSDHRFQTFEARLDALALSAVSTAQEDPLWNREDPWRRSQTPWSGGAGAAPRSSSQEGAAQSGFPGADPLRSWYADDELQRSAPGIPPGFPEPQPASQPAWQPWTYDNYASSRSYTSSEFRPDLRKWKEAQLDLSVKPEIFKAWQLRALRMLSDDRLDIRRRLDWAEKHDAPIDSAAAQIGAQKAGVC